MESKKPLTFTLSIVAIILGCTLFKQFSFETLQFKNTGLGIVYLITFLLSIYFLFKNKKK
jgi:hypothetical protein